MKLLKNILEVMARAVTSFLWIILVSMVYNMFRFKCSALFIFVLIVATGFLTLIYILRKRGLATIHEELDTMFPIAKKLTKYNYIIGFTRVIILTVALTFNISCTTTMLNKYDGIDEQFAEMYSVSEDAIAIMRCIPGTFAVRAYYVVTTEMDDFDFDYYDRLLYCDYMFFASMLLYGLLDTTYCHIERYRKSVRRFEDANY